MISFGFGRKKDKKEERKAARDFADHSMDGAGTEAFQNEIAILGPGCARCKALEIVTNEALEELGQKAVIRHISDFETIASYGVMSTPGLVVNGEVKSFGRVISKDEAMALLQESLQ